MIPKAPSRIITLLERHQAKYFNKGDEEMSEAIDLTPTSSSSAYGSSPHPPEPEHGKHKDKPEEDEDSEAGEAKKKEDAEAEKKKQQPHPGSSGGTVPGSGSPSGGYSPQR